MEEISLRCLYYFFEALEGELCELTMFICMSQCELPPVCLFRCFMGAGTGPWHLLSLVVHAFLVG